MAKQRSHPAGKQNTESSAAGVVQAQIQGLLKRKKYRQALEEVKKLRRSQPDLQFSPTEGEIWSLRGRDEFEKGDYKQAETSFRQALNLGQAGEAHYWLARTLLHLNRLDAALDLIKTAFEQNQLPKEYAICYLKLLFLNGQPEQVETLITKQSKRFPAAQIHWARGVLALQANQPEAALPFFQKIKRPLTPGDVPNAWVVYTHQSQQNWEAAARSLGLPAVSGFMLFRPQPLKEEILQRLSLLQRATTGHPPLNPTDLYEGAAQEIPFRGNRALQEAVAAIATLQLLEREDYHNAAHAFLNAEQRPVHLPELNTLRTPLLIQAGEQALRDGEPECTEAFWKPVLAEQFNPQLAVNLRVALDLNGSYQEEQRLLTRLVKWVEEDGKKHPENWSGDRLPHTLADLHCYLADVWMALGKGRTAQGAMQQAERLYPKSPEVMGRKGLIAYAEDRYPEAVDLMTQALEGGCESEEVYSSLIDCLDEMGDAQGKLAARRRFGQRFGDANPEAEIEFAPWLMALYSRDYKLFSAFVQNDKKPDPPMRALQIFVEAVQSPPNSGGNVSVNQEQAKQAWDTFLGTLSGDKKIEALQAIALSLQLFTKREKGIAALTNDYLSQLLEMGKDNSAAWEAYLVGLAVKDSNRQKLDASLRRYLETVPQPGNTLAQLQLQAHRFGWVRTLVPALEAALKREPQNPLLLLARSTTYFPHMDEHEELKQKGFEIARRIQDARALQAFREEEAFINLKQSQAYLPDPSRIDSMDFGEMDQFIENLIRQMFGNKMPKAELERMLPMLKQQMMGELSLLGNDEDYDEDYDEDDDDDFFIDMIQQKKRKRSFRDL